MKSVKNRILQIVLSFLFILILTASGIQDRLSGNWTYQEVPQLTSSIVDIKFLDSLTGYLTANMDTNLYKTTNGGYNWSRNFSSVGWKSRIQFINTNTGFLGSATKMFKTTNRGGNWIEIPKPLSIGVNDLYALNEDTIWVADEENLDGGVFRTTNGGNNWTQQWGNINVQNPNRIYMYNRNFGFMTRGDIYDAELYRTTNSGINWTLVSGGRFFDIKFFDTLIGYKASNEIKKTTDGGLSWITLSIPLIQPPGESKISGFSFINKDTVWGGGGYILLGNKFRGVLYNSTTGGNTWRYQIPDTAINTINYSSIQFLNAKTGWAYAYNGKGLHTILGGDTSFVINAIHNNQSSLFPEDYFLYQNYPNPFNPFTTIKFGIKRSSHITLEVFDMKGGRVKMIIDNRKLNSGLYEYGFDGSGLSSGIYFYRLQVSGVKKFTTVKKMVLIK